MKRTSILLFSILFLLAIASCGGGSSTTDDGDDSGVPGTPATAPDGSTGEPYDMGSPTLTDIYVSPTGDDGNAGTSVVEPLETLAAAWAMIPAALTTTGYRINLLPGSYPCGDDELTSCTNYFSDKVGSFASPVVIRSVDAAGAESAGAATVRGGMDVNTVSYFYVLGVVMLAGRPDDDALPMNNSGNNIFHIANSDHVLLRDVEFYGPTGLTDTTSNVQEVVKANQCEDVYIEDSELYNTYQTVVDFFTVQGGHLLNNRIYNSGGRCAYFKGGSGYIRVEGNEFYSCHEAGVQAGEGSNLNLMRAPWLHYEAYDIKFINNVIHDIYGAGLSVSGGYNIFMAYNTLYKIGLSDDRDWSLMQFVHGNRSCVIVDEYPSEGAASDACQDLLDDGGWGTAEAGGTSETGGDWVPNKNIFIYNNIFYNPASDTAVNSLIAVNGPLTLPTDAQNIPDPAETDDHLVIRGNIIWNGGASISLLATTNGTDAACTASNATCNETQLAADNVIDSFEPALTDPEGGDYTPTAAGNVITATAYLADDFTWDTWPAASDVPEGDLSNEVTENRDGDPRTGADHPGAY